MGFQQIGAAINAALLAVFRSVSFHNAFSAGFGGSLCQPRAQARNRQPRSSSPTAGHASCRDK
ncbi:hypothetical protein AXF42_Ash018230 [Apostasia shenzhenica]|uniref:Uncharacterized protein n=1 Tax=Apostasia shenzhenica TaxID=1088818 RepID=A0A2I0B1E4_9ASPA|nr:hypothetical protein AXF42_Ash018230 [Apostasia shenzhenica]